MLEEYFKLDARQQGSARPRLQGKSESSDLMKTCLYLFYIENKSC